ncbi:MAG: hypothetical protein CFK52_04500 [Chloracidobacterium sp. CP2_5A]|nr:MAG: hypothetical protein CFK52_04500 [Chloracidobacterium sp. CP2_5A]
MVHHCRYDFPPEKCFDLGCEHFYTQVQARFETISDLLLALPTTEAELQTQLSDELEACLRTLRDFHIVFPECSAADCLAGVAPALPLEEGNS